MAHKYRIILIIVFSPIIFTGCLLNYVAEKTYLVSQHGTLSSTTVIDYPIDNNNTIIVQLDKNPKDIKVYVDNRFDVERKNVLMERLYKTFLETKYIKGKHHLQIVNQTDNYINSFRFGYLQLNSKYSIKQPSYCFFDCPKYYIDHNKLKNNDSKITINAITPKEYILSFYYNITFQGLANLMGIEILYKLDENALNNDRLSITDGFLKKYTLKKEIINNLKNIGFTITEDINQSDMIILTENLGYTSILRLYRDLQYPKSLQLTYQDLFKAQKHNYSKYPKKILNYNSVFSNELLDYTNIHTPGGVITEREYGGPIASSNLISIYYNEQKVGNVIDLAISKSKEVIEMKYHRNSPQVTKSHILSDEIIDELNEQAAKQVLSKIKFIEK